MEEVNRAVGIVPTSGIHPFGFLCFQNTKNPLKIQKIFETCNLETQVYVPEN